MAEVGRPRDWVEKLRQECLERLYTLDGKQFIDQGLGMKMDKKLSLDLENYEN